MIDGRWKRIATWAAAAIATCAMAQAATVDVALYNSTFPAAQPVGPAVLGAAGDQWNWIDVGFCPSCLGSIGLINTAGASSGVSMSLVGQGGVISATTNTQPDPNLTNTYMFDNSFGSLMVTLSGLGPSVDYQLVLYVSSDDAHGGNRALTGMVTGSTITPFSATGNPQSSFVDGSNVVLLDVMSSPAGTLTIQEDNPGNSSGEVDMNGFQLQSPAPEPGAFVLAGIGLLLCARHMRRS